MKICKLDVMGKEKQITEINNKEKRFVIHLNDGKTYFVNDSENESWIEEVKIQPENMKKMQRLFLDNIVI